MYMYTYVGIAVNRLLTDRLVECLRPTHIWFHRFALHMPRKIFGVSLGVLPEVLRRVKSSED